MEGRRVNRQSGKRNPLFVLFLSLVAIVIILLIVATILFIRLHKANKSLDDTKDKITELADTIDELQQNQENEKTITALEPRNSTGTGLITEGPSPQGSSAVPLPGATGTEPETGTVPPTQGTETNTVVPTANETSSSSWLDLSGQTDLAVKPTDLLDRYYTYYTTAGVNVRSGPSTDYGRLTTASAASTVEVAARQGNWSFVRVNGRFGWINSDYLSTTKPVITSSSSSRSTATSGSLRR